MKINNSFSEIVLCWIPGENKRNFSTVFCKLIKRYLKLFISCHNALTGVQMQIKTTFSMHEILLLICLLNNYYKALKTKIDTIVYIENKYQVTSIIDRHKMACKQYKIPDPRREIQ